jgi:hypothetical protein
MKITNDSIDTRSLTRDELLSVMYEAQQLYDQAFAELDRWSTVRCTICQRENVAYRDTPWIGWTTSSGFTLCNICTSKWERKYNVSLTGTPVDNPVDEVMALLD